MKFGCENGVIKVPSGRSDNGAGPPAGIKGVGFAGLIIRVKCGPLALGLMSEPSGRSAVAPSGGGTATTLGAAWCGRGNDGMICCVMASGDAASLGEISKPRGLSNVPDGAEGETIGDMTGG